MKLKLFLLLVAVQLLLYALSAYILIEDSLIWDFWGEKLSYERILKLIEESKKWRWVPYLLIPLLTFIKCALIACCLYTGAFFIKSTLRLGDFFKIATLAEFTSLLLAASKIFWFGLIHRNYGLEDLNYFSPLSLLNLFDRTEVEVWLMYPLQVLSVFELLYWLVLAYLLKEPLRKSLVGSLIFVAYTYGIGLLLWVITIMFITISLN